MWSHVFAALIAAQESLSGVASGEEPEEEVAAVDVEAAEPDVDMSSLSDDDVQHIVILFASLY